MSNRKFNLDNEVQPEIHFRLLSISASKFENDWTSFPHSHHFTEIFFIKDGTGRMLIENESLPVSSNSLVVIGAQVTHTEFSDPKNPLDYYVLGVIRKVRCLFVSLLFPCLLLVVFIILICFSMETEICCFCKFHPANPATP